MTDDQFQAWLKSPDARRVVLIEATAQVAGVETVMYMATKPYNTSPTDAPANTHYRPIVAVGVLFTEELSLTGDGALSAGDVEIDNYAGERDAWLGYVWTNRTFKAYVGDVRWPRADFRPIFDGITADIAPRGRLKLALKLRDKLQRLNTPITEAKLGGLTQNKDALIPMVFGEVHNVSPLLIDPAALEYQVHGGAVEDIFEVRDNGIPVAATVDNVAGTFTLEHSPAGAVTVSVQGDKEGAVSYRTSCSQLVQRLVTGYGKATDRFTVADLDMANLAAFDAAHPEPMQLAAPDRLNVLAACQMLTGSLGAQMSMSSLGKLRLIQIALPAPGVPVVVRPQQMVERTLEPVSRTEAVGAVKLGFAKNWTVQALVTAIPEEHKALYATEWLTTTKSDAGVLAAYKLNGEPLQQDTMLIHRADADAEALRRLGLWKVPRTTYQFDGLPELLTLELGQAITVFHPRFGMEHGVTGMVVSLGRDWLTCRIKVGFIV
jgi:hypothetical protein